LPELVALLLLQPVYRRGLVRQASSSQRFVARVGWVRKSFGEERKRGTCARLTSMMPIYGARARRRHALEHARDGQALRLEPEHGEPHLAGPLRCSRIESRASSFPKTRCSSRKCAISSDFTSIRPTARWCCASTRRARSRHSIAVSRCCRCAPARSGVLPTICVTALPTGSPRWTSRRAP
jgi:hypothetical protein